MGQGPQESRRTAHLGFLPGHAGALLPDPQTPVSLDGEPSSTSVFVIHICVRVKYGPAVFAGGDVNCVPLMLDGGVSGGVDEGAATREVAAVWGKASRARWPEGPGVVKGREPGILCVSGPSVFWAC